MHAAAGWGWRSPSPRPSAAACGFRCATATTAAASSRASKPPDRSTRRGFDLARPAVDQPLAFRGLAVLLEVVLDQSHVVQARHARVRLEGLVGRRLQAVDGPT